MNLYLLMWGKMEGCLTVGVIEPTEFHKRLKSDQLNLPTVNETKNNLNLVFLGDEAFALSKHFLRPYPQKHLTYGKRIYNYRLSRTRNVSEDAFGLVNSRFRISNICINMAAEKFDILCWQYVLCITV